MILLALVIIDQTWEVPNYHRWLRSYSHSWMEFYTNINECQKYHVEWKKPDLKDMILYNAIKITYKNILSDYFRD